MTQPADGVRDGFRVFARNAATAMGTSWAFLVALLAVAVWAAAGPLAGFSEVWQLTINTGTTIVTFLMVFLIQNTQNRDSVAIQVKLDELLKVLDEGYSKFVDVENASDEELSELKQQFADLREDFQAASGAKAG